MSKCLDMLLEKFDWLGCHDWHPPGCDRVRPFRVQIVGVIPPICALVVYQALNGECILNAVGVLVRFEWSFPTVQECEQGLACHMPDSWIFVLPTNRCSARGELRGRSPPAQDKVERSRPDSRRWPCGVMVVALVKRTWRRAAEAGRHPWRSAMSRRWLLAWKRRKRRRRLWTKTCQWVARRTASRVSRGRTECVTGCGGLGQWLEEEEQQELCPLLPPLLLAHTLRWAQACRMPESLLPRHQAQEISRRTLLRLFGCVAPLPPRPWCRPPM